MKKMTWKQMSMAVLLVVASMFFAVFAFAAGMEENSQSATGMTNPQSQAQAMRSNITADELRGMTVLDQSGKDIGKISDVMVDNDTGQVSFVILAKGGVIGIGASKHAVPIRALNVNADKKQATLNVDESLLANAPTQPASMSNKDFELQLEQHYGIAPAWKPEQHEGASAPEMQEEANPPAVQEQEQQAPSNEGGD